jgi:UDPglucose 6-dehydrogenase
VTAVDRDAALIAAWNSDHLPVFEPGLEDILYVDQSSRSLANNDAKPAEKRIRLPNLTFSTHAEMSISAAEVIFICVDTPLMVSI